MTKQEIQEAKELVKERLIKEIKALESVYGED